MARHDNKALIRCSELTKGGGETVLDIARWLSYMCWVIRLRSVASKRLSFLTLELLTSCLAKVIRKRPRCRSTKGRTEVRKFNLCQLNIMDFG